MKNFTKNIINRKILHLRPATEWGGDIVPLILIFLILLLAFVLRFYRLRDYLIFLGDQGRDVWVVKKMVVDGKFTLLGPVASVGGFYLGPLYYYLITPFLLLANFDPIGPAFFIVLSGTATCALMFWYARKKFGFVSASIAAFLYAISPVLIQYNRFSWNPNLVPLASLIFYIFLEKAIKDNKPRFFLLSGIMLGVLFQLHYLAFVFLPVTVIMLLFKSRRNIKSFIESSLLVFFGIIIGWFPFILYELRHSFQNFNGLIEFLGRKDGANVGFDPTRYFLALKTNSAMIIYHLFHVPRVWNIVLRLLIIFYLLKNVTARTKAKQFLAVFAVFMLFAIALYKGKMEAHYLNVIYVFIILIIAEILQILGRINKIIVLIALLLILNYSSQIYYFWQTPNKQLDQTINISKFIFDEARGKKFNFALITQTNSDHAYRYFFDLWGNPSVELDPNSAASVTDKLMVLCEPLTKNCDPRGSPLWEILGFGDFYIARQWHRHVFQVYELKHSSTNKIN